MYREHEVFNMVEMQAVIRNSLDYDTEKILTDSQSIDIDGYNNMYDRP